MGAPVPKLSRIGRYEVSSVIGWGGMGTVYCATDPRIGRRVAIKVLAGGHSEDPDLLARFYREAKCTGSLQHQNIVTVYELGDQDGCPYLVMQYLEGESLDAMISARRPLQISEKLGIMVQVCNGLNYAHQQGVIHRDIKPANIVILKDGTAKIVDFGIAHVPGKRLTRKGQLVGSFYYMSPEQLNGNLELDLRTDVYSAGVVLFQLLTGVLPFEGKDTASTLFKIVHGPRPPLSSFLSGYPPELETINQKALAIDREDRYASAEDFAFDLARLRQQLEQEMLAGCLQQAVIAIQHHSFDIAKQQLMQALRIDTHNKKARELSRELQKAVESERCRQQVIALRSQAEEACNHKHFDAALKCLQQALELDRDNSDLLRLRDSVNQAQQRAASFSDGISRARVALQRGELVQARQAIEQALAIEPDDIAAKALASSIARQQEVQGRQQQARNEDAVKRTKQSVLAVNAVEKAMSDARMLLFLNDSREAEAALDQVSKEISLVPSELRLQVERLRRDIREKLGEYSRDASLRAAVAERGSPVPSDPATLLGQPDLKELDSRPVRELQPPTLSTKGGAATPEESPEYSPAQRSAGLRLALIVSALVMIIALGVWLKMGRPKAVVPPITPQVSSASVAVPSYAEINAEPWGTVKQVSALNGESVLEVNDTTPLRVPLPAGQYLVRVEGPNHQTETITVEVPAQGGKSYFVLFQKPDIQKIVTSP